MLATPPRSEPWLAEGAIHFLKRFLRPSMRVLEFGAGASTPWFADRVCDLVSVEGSPRWHMAVAGWCRDKPSVRLLLCPDYHGALAELPDERFDLVLVDGRNRVQCFLASDRVLRPGGCMMLDNSERPRYAECFRQYWDRPRTSAEQTGPDRFGFWYEGWTTTWWMKEPATGNPHL